MSKKSFTEINYNQQITWDNCHPKADHGLAWGAETFEMLPLINWLKLPHFSLVFFNFDLISNAVFALSRIFCAPTLKFLATCAPVRQLYLTACSKDLPGRLHEIHTGIAKGSLPNSNLPRKTSTINLVFTSLSRKFTHEGRERAFIKKLPSACAVVKTLFPGF